MSDDKIRSPKPTAILKNPLMRNHSKTRKTHTTSGDWIGINTLAMIYGKQNTLFDAKPFDDPVCCC